MGIILRQIIAIGMEMNKVIQLIDIKNDMCKAWEKSFEGCDNVHIHCDNIFSVDTDCVVSPANSFGFMDGGLDRVLLWRFGSGLQDKLQKIIREKYNGELLVGQAELMDTRSDRIPYLISAPTMRVPMIIDETVNVYLASKAIFNIVKNNDRITTVTIGGLGTGVGLMPCDISAKQMRKAYDDVFVGSTFPEDWYEAQTNHQMLYCDVRRDLQRRA